MSSDFNFEDARPQGKRIDFKDLFFNPEQGLNTVRIADLKGKSFKVHYVKNVDGKYVFVKSPGAGDPLIVAGNQPKTRYYLKVIDRKTNKLKIWEFGSQIKISIEEFVNEFRAKREKGAGDDSDVLTNYDLELRKRQPGSNPLYTLGLGQKLNADNPRDAQTLAKDQSIIDADEIDFEPLLKPWTVERIKEQILGIAPGTDIASGDDIAPSENQSPAVQASTSTPQLAQVAQQAQVPVSAAAPKAQPQSSLMAQATQADNSWLDED